MNHCQACKKPIPTRLHFCRVCLSHLDSELRHKVLFSNATDETIRQAVAAVERSRAEPPATEAGNRFRAAREHAARALRILDRKEKEP